MLKPWTMVEVRGAAAAGLKVMGIRATSLMKLMLMALSHAPQ